MDLRDSLEYILVMDQAAEPKYQVVWPAGPHIGVTAAELAARLPDLSGRTVAFVWDHVFNGPGMFEQFTATARSRFGDVAVVGHEEFGNIHGTSAEEHEAVAELPARLRAHRVDAAVVGVGA